MMELITVGWVVMGKKKAKDSLAKPIYLDCYIKAEQRLSGE